MAEETGLSGVMCDACGARVPITGGVVECPECGAEIALRPNEGEQGEEPLLNKR